MNALAAASFPGPDSLDELRQALRLEMGRGATPMEAARAALERLTLDDETEQQLILRGATQIANQVAQDDRLPAEPTPATRPIDKQGPTTKDRDALLRVALVGADGVMKPILRFHRADVQAVRAQAASQVLGWSRREEAMATAEGMLNLHKVDVIADLPVRALTTVRDAVAEAWR